MKILYAIQGTGNGHVARAREIVPALMRYCKPDILISGIQSDVEFPLPIQYRYGGLSFIFGKKGGVDLLDTFRQAKLGRLGRELQHFPVKKYDLIINDFEPISAWAAKLKGVPCFSLSHQCAVLAAGAPRPDYFDPVGVSVLKMYAPSNKQYGFHFDRYNPNIYTPVIRGEVRSLQPQNLGHYTVYLPSYSDELLLSHLGRFKQVRWEVFSKHNKTPIQQGNVQIRPIQNDAFLQSMAAAEGVLCGAGFETPAEALFLGKKLLCIPMKGQYEQHCNAAGLKLLGVPIIPALDALAYPSIEAWIEKGRCIPVNYPDEVDAILQRLLLDAARLVR
jgi:uncharacterized protein (TIGR00661 family)